MVEHYGLDQEWEGGRVGELQDIELKRRWVREREREREMINAPFKYKLIHIRLCCLCVCCATYQHRSEKSRFH